MGISGGLLFKLPKDARILDVQVQNECPCMWALVNPNNETEYRRFYIYGTGHPMPDKLGDFIGTFQLHDGALIFHLFEESL
jgi:hypothetical protein